MKFPLTYQQAKKQFPKEIKEIAKQIKSSKSKFKDIDLKELTWSISTSEVIEGIIIHISVEENIKRISQNTTSYLQGVYKQLHKQVKLDYNPQIVIDCITKMQNEQEAERIRVESLSPEEKEKELSEALEQFFAGGGMFIGIN
jgi:hypothetical protein